MGLIELREWDSNFFGFKCGGVVGDVSLDFEESVVYERDSGEYDFLLHRHILGKGKLDVSVLGRLGFSYIDTHRILDLRFDKFNAPLGRGVMENFSYAKIDSLLEEKMRELKLIASDLSSVSRFAKDSKIDSQKVLELYDQWIDNSFSGQMADAIYIAKNALGKIVGFVTFKVKNGEGSEGSEENFVDLSLLAVDSGVRGRGVGKGLVNYALNDLKKSGKYAECEVVVSSENTGAVRFYEKLGFLQQKDTQIYHWHRSK